MHLEGRSRSPNACDFAALGKLERELLELVNKFRERVGCFDVKTFLAES